MTDELALFLVLWLVYVTECFIWVGRDSLVFANGFGWGWKVKAGSRFLRTGKGGILLLNPLPPLGSVVGCHLMPLSVSPEGVCNLNAQTLTFETAPDRVLEAYRFEEMGDVRADENDLMVNGRRFTGFRDSKQAAGAAGLLNTLTKAAPKDRASIISRFWEVRFDLEAARARLNEQAFHRRTLKTICNVMFVYLFVLAPAVVIGLKMSGMLIPLAAGMFALAVPISIGYYLGHRKLYPDSRGERVTNAIKMFLFPPSAMRAGDLLTENLTADYNPLTIARLLLSDYRWSDFASVTLRNLHHPPLGTSVDTVAAKIIAWQNRLLLDFASMMMADRPGILAESQKPPESHDPDVRAYCPRCLAQYTHQEGDCPDCPGVRLLPMERGREG